MKLKNIVIFVLLSLFSGHSFGAKIYEANISVYHKDQLIAQPDMKVNEGEESKVLISLPGSEKYSCTVLINSTVNDKVNVSVKFSSGNLVFNPEFSAVELGKKTSAVMNDFEIAVFIK